jgi:hypothetical protein
MPEYLYNERDLDFILYEQLGIERLFQLPKYKDFSRDEMQLVIREALKLTQQQIAPTNEIGDQEGLKFAKGKVTAPGCFGPIYNAVKEGGWIGLASSAKYGGGGLPSVIGTAVGEMTCGSNLSFATYQGLTRGAAELLIEFGTEEMKQLYVTRMLSGQWQGTMCLTEPGCGTAVGDSKTTAEPKGDHYLIRGNKIFISAGEHNLCENVIHLVLAKTPRAPAGTKGLSIFIVPKIRVNADGSLGEPNDVVCTNIEHKMGIHASPTCAMSFGDNNACHGYLIGKEFEGIKIMFMMMNDARIGVGLQGLALASAAHLLALRYAKERIQGVHIREMRNPEAPRVAIIEHPDVRRMLMTQKAYVEGMRAMTLSTALAFDLCTASEDEAEREWNQNFADLMTGVVKAYNTDVGFEVGVSALQTHGGYGYIREYGVEQHVRDLKIGSIYEGTNGVQAMDLLGRKLVMKEGLLLRQLIEKINGVVETNHSHATLGSEFGLLGKYLGRLAETAMAIGGRVASKGPEWAGLASVPFMRMLGNVVVGWQLLEQANIASSKLPEVAEGHSDREFYQSKIYTAKFFVNRLLCQNDALGKDVMSEDSSVFDIHF